MKARCPRCGCVDVHTSRTRSSIEKFFRNLGFPPRRCAACGWRGIYPRWFISKAVDNQGHKPTSAVIENVTNATTNTQKCHHHHKHRRHHDYKRSNSRGHLGALLIAIIVGACAAVMVNSCNSTEQSVFKME